MILLEELLKAGFDAVYDAWLINIGDDDQFSSGFVEINLNSKMPALIDHSITSPQRVFKSFDKAVTFLDGASFRNVLRWYELHYARRKHRESQLPILYRTR